MTEAFGSAARNLSAFTDAPSALDRICDIYRAGADALRQSFDAFLAGSPDPSGEAPCYPYVGIAIDPQEVTPRRRDVLRQAARRRRLRHHRHPPRHVPRLLPRAAATAAGQLRQADLGRHQPAADSPLLRPRGGDGGPDARAGSGPARPLSPARTVAHRRCHRQRHLCAAARHAAAAGLVRRHPGRLLAGAPQALHGDLAATLSALRPVHQLPALCRRVRRLRPGSGLERRGLSGLRGAGATW